MKDLEKEKEIKEEHKHSADGDCCHGECEENCDCEHECEDGCDCENESCGDDCDCGHDHGHEHKPDPRFEYIVALEKDLKEAEEQVLRAKAEMINYRKRMEEEQLKMFKYINEDMIKNILPIVDNFERAISLDDNNLDDELSKFLSGFKMVYEDLTKTIKKYDVKEIEALGKEFDANYHEAVATEKSNDKAGMVIEVLQKGYMLKDKVIRPAMVKVSE